MFINIVVAVIILLAGIIFAMLQYKKGNSKAGVMCSIVVGICLSVFSGFVNDAFKQFLPMSNEPASSVYSDKTGTELKDIYLDGNSDLEFDSLDIVGERNQNINHSDSKKSVEEKTERNQTNASKLWKENASIIDSENTVNSQNQNVILGTGVITDINDNDSSENAQNFTMGDIIEGSISLEGDVDFFKFSLLESGQVGLDILSYMKYYTLIIYDTTGVEIWYTDNNEFNQTVGFREDTHSVNLISGDYFLKVTGYKYGASYASTGRYKIETTFLSANTNEIEPNNKADEANLITLGYTIQGLIGENDRYDFYQFALLNSGRVCLDITSYMRYYTLVLFDETGTEIWYSDNNEYNETVKFKEDIYYLDLESGNFFLRVTGYKYGTNHASTGNYTIKTSFISSNATEIEPNNISSEATKVSLGNTIYGLIGINDKCDFYEFTLSKSEKVTFDITSYMRYYCLILYDATGTQV